MEISCSARGLRFRGKFKSVERIHHETEGRKTNSCAFRGDGNVSLSSHADMCVYTRSWYVCVY